MLSPNNHKKMSEYSDDQKIFIGDLLPRVRKNDVEKAFARFGTIKCVWLARNPPGFAFIAFSDPRDAADAVRDRDGRTVCGQRARVKRYSERLVGVERRRTEISRTRGSNSCYDCGEKGHLARECRQSRRGRFEHRSRSGSRSRDRFQPQNSYGRSARQSFYPASSVSPRRTNATRIERRSSADRPRGGSTGRSRSRDNWTRSFQRTRDPRFGFRSERSPRNRSRSRRRSPASHTPDGPRTPINSPYRKNRDSDRKRPPPLASSRDSVTLELSIDSPKSRLIISKTSRASSASSRRRGHNRLSTTSSRSPRSSRKGRFRSPSDEPRRRSLSKSSRRRRARRNSSSSSKFRPQSPSSPSVSKYRSASVSRDRGGAGDGKPIKYESRSSTYSRSRSKSLSLKQRGQKH